MNATTTEPVGRLGRRGVVLAFLRDAQPNGIDQRTIAEEGRVRDVPTQVASLIAEGFNITSLTNMDGGEPTGARYYLLDDPWASLPDAVAPVAVEG